MKIFEQKVEIFQFVRRKLGVIWRKRGSGGHDTNIGGKICLAAGLFALCHLCKILVFSEIENTRSKKSFAGIEFCICERKEILTIQEVG